jgi:hypothetical protein
VLLYLVRKIVQRHKFPTLKKAFEDWKYLGKNISHHSVMTNFTALGNQSLNKDRKKQ